MPLITTIAEFKKYVAIDGNMKWASIEPYVKEAELLYVKPLLGKEFYDEFLALYEASIGAGPALSAENTALLPYIQRCLAFYTQLKAIPHLAVKFGELGIRQDLSQDSMAAPRWQQEQLLLTALISGDTHADQLLEFLEAEATGLNDYATWYASSANTKLIGLLVYGTAIASKHIAISDSRRVFLQLLPYIKTLETKYIPKLISQEMYDVLLADIKAATISAENAVLMARVEPIIAKRVLFMRLPFMRVSIAADGLWLYSDVKEIRAKDFLADREAIKALRFELCEGQLGYQADENELKQFILDNIDDYPEIKASTVYTIQPDPGPTFTYPKNDPDNKHFVV